MSAQSSIRVVILIKVGFIGAGKVGFSLGKYFAENGTEVEGYYSRKLSSAVEASNFTGTRYFSDINELLNTCNIIFVTTPDDEIYNLWTSIRNMNIRDKIICHTSGSLSSNIFYDADQSDVYSYSIHPVFPISDKYESYKSLKEACFTIEGHPKYLGMLVELFQSMGNNIIPLNRQEKTLYHLAAVTVSNLFCGLMDRACGYLKEYGFEEKQAIEALYPLVLSNINNIREKGITRAVTGPVERGDFNTVRRHIEVMPEHHRIVYSDLSRELVNISRKKHEDRNYERLENYLEGTK
jgi:predicted short-subunit dehydrogenase-like oxidoreductase (DUF2520 family)